MIKPDKSPAFQWYPKDYMSDKNTRLMTLEERGAYVELMNYEWNEKGLPICDKDLAELSGLGIEKWNGKSGEKIKKCFEEKGGKLIHPRLERERLKQADWRAKCSAGGKKSAEIRELKKGKGSGKVSSTKVKEVKHKHGEHKNVLLTDGELQKLKDKFPDWKEKIDNASNYFPTVTKVYKSHYHTILNWARGDAKKISTSSKAKADTSKYDEKDQSDE